MIFIAKKRVALVLTNDLLSPIIKLLVNSDEYFKTVGETNEYENVRSLVFDTKPDIVLMDLKFDDKIRPIDIILEIKKIIPHCLILIFSEIKAPNVVFSCFKSGASGYVLSSPYEAQRIVSILKDLSKGGSPLSSVISKMVVKSFHVNHNSILSKRESKVFQLLSEGRSYSEIAEELLIGKGTAKTHLKNIYKKLNVNKKSQAIAAGAEHRIIYNHNVRSSKVKV